jgi:hypothetical protein
MARLPRSGGSGLEFCIVCAEISQRAGNADVASCIAYSESPIGKLLAVRRCQLSEAIQSRSSHVREHPGSGDARHVAWRRAKPQTETIASKEARS